MNSDEHYYAFAAEEIATGRCAPGLMAKAYAHSDGDWDRARATYIKWRVQQLKEDVKTATKAAVAVAKQKLQEELQASSSASARERREARRRKAEQVRKQKEALEVEAQRTGEAWDAQDARVRPPEPISDATVRAASPDPTARRDLSVDEMVRSMRSALAASKWQSH